jgi:hypothetical protein
MTHSPYIIAEPVKTSDNPDSFEDFNSTSDFYRGKSFEELFTYDKLPQLLHEPVIVELPDKRCEAEHGLQSFLHATGPAHFFQLGDTSRVTIGTLWWRPKGAPKHECFYQPGEYGISYHAENPPTTWAAITTTTPVFVFNDTSSYDACEVDFIVGTTNDPLDFYRNDAWAGYSPHDESPHEPQEESYRESLDFIIRSIIGKCVPQEFKLYEIRRFLKDSSAPIVEIKYHFKTGNKFVNPRKAYKPNSKGVGAMSPAEITVKTSTGEKIRLKLY